MMPPRVPPATRPTIPPGTVPGERRLTWDQLLGKPTSLTGAGIPLALGDIPGQTAATKKFLRSTGTGTVAGVPAWDTVLPADVTPDASATRKFLRSVSSVSAWDTLQAADVAAGTYPSGSFTYPGALTVDGALTAAALLDLSGASAGQIKFPSSQHASSDANTLDDYEEGSWTPGLTFGGGSVGVTFAAAVGRYTKVGNIVRVQGHLELSSKGSSTGGAIVTGLPFTASSDSNAYQVGTLRIAGLSAVPVAAGLWTLTNPATNTAFVLYLSSGGVETFFVDSQFANTTSITITNTYRV